MQHILKAYQVQQELTDELVAQKSHDRFMLLKAHKFAKDTSDCKKVTVGALIVDQHQRAFYGSNRTMPRVCTCRDTCEVDGHCVSTIHAEIDAIVRSKCSLYKSTIYVTRYPCEACARAVVVAGIKTVVYARSQEISIATKDILHYYDIEVRHVRSLFEGDEVVEEQR